jgi:hypothetical protein
MSYAEGSLEEKEVWMKPGFMMNAPDPNKPVRQWISYYSMELPVYNCPTCNTELDTSHPAYNLTKLIDYVGNNHWGMFEDYSVGDAVTVPGATVPIRIAAIKGSYDTGDVDVEGYYGESALPQGSTFNTYIVFQIGNQYYRKTGTGDSYGEVSWDGDIRGVTATEKVIKEFK